MSSDAGGLPPALPDAGSLPPALPQEKRLRWPWFVAGAFVVLAGIVFASAYRKFPTEEERKYFGWWHGTIRDNELQASAWVAEFREDGAIRIRFGRYHRVNQDKAWQFSSSEEIGRWRVRDGVQHLRTADPERPDPWYSRFERWTETGETRRSHYYRTTRIDNRELHYTQLPGGPDFFARRAAGPIELPPEPLPPEQWPLPAAGAKK
jgi:hypothetical protein